MTTRWIRAALAIAAILVGAATSFGFEPVAVWPVTFIGFALLLERVSRASTWREAFGAGWYFGVGHFIVGLNWIATAFTYQANMPASFGVGAVVLLAAYLALFVGATAAIAWRASRGGVGPDVERTEKPSIAGRLSGGLASGELAHSRDGDGRDGRDSRDSRDGVAPIDARVGAASLSFVFLFAAAWIVTEWLRSTLFTGFAWNPLGTVWLGILPIAQAASFIGAYGMSGVVIAASGALWFTYHRQWRPAIATAAVLAVLALLPERPQSPGGIAVRIVQPNIGQDEKYDPEQILRHERIYMRLSGKPASTPRLLLWPEDATLRFLELEPKARASLAKLLGPRDVLLTGGESVEVDKSGNAETYHNSVFALDANARLLWRYDKAHLVPFGEYLPLRPLLERIGLSRLVPGEGDFASGPGPRTFAVPGFGNVAVQICYEIIFPGQVLEERLRPTFLFNPSNDAWFGSWGPPQHFAQARMRAIEEGVPVVRATPTGITGIIGPTGRIVTTLPRGREGVLDAVVPPPNPPTFFSRMGLWVTAVFALALGAAGVFARRFSR